MLYILEEFQIIGTSGINIDMLIFVFPVWKVRLFMIGDFNNGVESLLRQMLLKLLEPFPASEGIFDFWMIGGFETTIGAVVFEKSDVGQEFYHQNFYFYFYFFWDNFCTALSSNIVLWQTKTPNWVVLAWGECLNAFAGLKFRTETCVTSFRVNYLPWPVYKWSSKHKLIWSNLV